MVSCAPPDASLEATVTTVSRHTSTAAMPLPNWFRRASSATPTALTPPPNAADKRCAHCQVALPPAARYCFICGGELAGQTLSSLQGGDAAVVAMMQARLAHALAGRYRVGEVIGKGGMGIVFLADAVGESTQVAIKVLRPELSSDETGVARFGREAEIAASLRHPGIIPILEVGSEQGLHYFVMQYVAGCSLDALLRARKSDQRPLSVAAVARILSDAASTLAHAHAQGVVHRDVKPANIMLDEESRVLLTDFGISKSAAGSTDGTTAAALTEFGTVLGTPHYLAPEQALSRAVDGRADQYALAIVGFEMLTGSVPFDDETPHGIIHQHLNELAPRLTTLRADVPEHMSAAIARALLKAPSHRFPDMAAFARAIDPNVDRAARRWRRARQAAALLGAAAIAAMAAWASGIGR